METIIIVIIIIIITVIYSAPFTMRTALHYNVLKPVNIDRFSQIISRSHTH